MAFNLSEALGVPWGSQGGKDLGDLISIILNVSFTGAGILILFFLVFAGFQMIQAAGNHDEQAAEKAKKAATSAAIGFVVVFTAYWIIRIIELITGSNFITNPQHLNGPIN